MAGQTQLGIKAGSDNQIFRHDTPARVKRSSFPYGRKRDFCIDPGAIVPIDLWETLPGDYFEVDLDYILKSFPLKVPPFTSYKVRTHWYYTKKHWLWKGALTYITKGRSHSISLSNPTLNVHAVHWSTDTFFDSPMSLSSYFGFEPGHVADSDHLVNSCLSWFLSSQCTAVSQVHDFYGGVNLLPFFFYQKIYRFAYVKPNLVQDSKCWFPDDMSDGWRINYDKGNLFSYSDSHSGVGSTEKVLFAPSGLIENAGYAYHECASVYDSCICLTDLRYAMFEDDRFTTALPWSTRGQAPTVNVDSSMSVDINIPSLPIESYVKFDDSLDFKSPITLKAYVAAGQGSSQTISVAGPPVRLEASGTPVVGLAATAGDIVIPPEGLSTTFHSSAATLSNVPVTVNSLGFDINDLRAKIALTVWQERNARTEGWYNEMIYQHFQENPDSEDYEPIYLGGTSDIISFSEVVQHDNSSSDVTAQGHAAGLGETRAGGHVFSFRSKDYGYIMGVMIIQPETVYNSKIEKLWLRKVQEDEYFPEYQGLGLQEILKGEIFPTGTSSDVMLFGYQERDTEYKTRDNQAIGFFALPHTFDRLMSAYSQCREFDSQPSLSQQFVTMSPANMRKDCLAVPSMPFFRCSLATRVHAVRPMAYKNTPNTFGF